MRVGRWFSGLVILSVAAGGACGAAPVAPVSGEAVLRELAQRGDRRVDVPGDAPAAGTPTAVVNVAVSEASLALASLTLDAVRLLDEWLGPLPERHLTIVEVPWSSPWAGASYPGILATHRRWLAASRDVSAERWTIAALARQYWQRANLHTEPSFAEGVIIYLATRAIHELLGGRNLEATEAFGGFVAYPMRALQLSPNLPQRAPRLGVFEEVVEPAAAPWRAAPTGADSAARRVARALHTLERYIGWPSLQAALASLWQTGDAVSAGRLAQVLREQRGVDLSGFLAAALAGDRDFDYAVVDLATVPDGERPGVYRSTVTVRRAGEGSLALPVQVRFEDGSDFTEYWDGRDSEFVLTVESRSPAVSAAVDPELVLLLDRQRANNAIHLQPAVHPTGIRLALHWFVWLQDLTLTPVVAP